MNDRSLFSLLSNSLGQLREVVYELNDTKYTYSLSILGGATIGQHLRHILEFYLCLFEALEARDPVVNYGNRRRDTALETKREKALKTITHIEEQLQKHTSDLSLTLQSFTEGIKVQARSSLYREYVFNLEHTVHHMALLRIGLREAAPSLTLDKSFGVARETIAYHKAIETKV